VLNICLFVHAAAAAAAALGYCRKVMMRITLLAAGFVIGALQEFAICHVFW
jgi:hypothetical protein